MIALDTNVLVRMFVDDDVAQTQRVRELLDSRTLLILPTVLLEAEWVLRGAYELDPSRIASMLRALFGLPNVKIANIEAVGQALAWFEAGLGFADALHLALAAEADEGFATFDKRLERRAQRLAIRNVVAV